MVGDPLKATDGPALNPMIKVVNLISLIIAPIIVQYERISVGTAVVIVVLLALIGFAIARSKRDADPLDLPTAVAGD